MAILQSETSLTTDQYNALMAATADINRQVVAYRQNPNFDSYLGRIARAGNLPFSVAADDDLLMRVYNDNGDIYAETISNASPVWSVPVLVTSTGQPGVRPRVMRSATWDVYVLDVDGTIYEISSSDDGATWPTTVAFSSETFTANEVSHLAVTAGLLPLAYLVVDTVSGAHNVVAVDATSQYDTGIYWSDTISGFDAIDFTGVEDDTTGDHDDTEARHCLVITGKLPNYYTFKTVGGLPAKVAQATGGTISFVVRPPLDGRDIQVSRWYPVQTIDQWHEFTEDRTGASLSSSSSVFDGSNDHDTMWVTVFGDEGDFNGSDTSYAYQVVLYYASRDGKHWTQERIVPLDTNLGLSPNDFDHGAALVVHGDYVWLLSCNSVLRSKGCLDFNNTHSTLQLDLTSYITEYSGSFNDARQDNLVLDNADGALWATFLGEPGVVSLITKFGLDDNLIQVSLEEVDSVVPNREQPNQFIQMTVRDRISWLTDRVENANAIQWDNQLASLDTFSDQNGVKDSGLAHSDVVKGSFTTQLVTDTLSLRTKYREGISFHTVGGGHVADGHCGSIFVIPKPTDFGGTSADDSPSYAGVVFRAQDKDNFWAVWYNYWTGKIELVERKNGASTIHVSHTPDSAFSTRANSNNSVGIRVEFKAGRIQVYESTVLYSRVGARYNPGFTHYVAPSTTGFLQGYVGVIGCGYSDQDEGESTEPEAIVVMPSVSGWGPMDSFNPTRYYALRASGEFYYGNGAVGAPGWTDISPNSTIRGILAGGSAPVAPAGSHVTLGCNYFIFDPYHLRRCIMLGGAGIAINDDVQTSSWYMMPTVPLASHWWGLSSQYITGANTMFGSITASINWEGYFCWLDYAINATTPPDTNNYFYYTYDNFATIHRTAISGSPGHCITIGQYATNWNNIKVFIARIDGSVIRSTNGGQSFSAYTYPSPTHPLVFGAAINLPYILPGGAPNTANTGLLASWHEYGFGWENVDSAGAKHLNGLPFNTSLDGPQSIASLTIDSRYLTIRNGVNDIWFSQDGGVSGVQRAITGDGSGAPYVTNLAGWPTNPNFVVCPGGTLTRVTFDAGLTWTNITPTSNIRHIVADLTERYDLGGVH